MSRGKLRPWRYRTPDPRDKDPRVHTFFAPTVVLADKYAKRWARKLGYHRVIRLRRRR
jgi:hypothetical protein